ncbi:MAG TPA: anti-sigma factor [Blastocatellia bacterium]|nr:anti-sigma factor [Blastocatellia bacterium]
MKHEVMTEEQQTSAALYAIGALSQSEANSFSAHLSEGCAACQAELNEFEKVVESLALGVPEASPASYLRDVLNARIEREAQNPPEREGSVISFPERASGWLARGSQPFAAWKTMLPWAIAASFFLAFAVSFVAWRMDRSDLTAQNGLREQEASSALEDNLQLREKLKRESARTDELNQINTVLASSQWRTLTLAGQEPAPSGSARVYWDLKSNRWVVSADLPAAPAGKTYQLWFLTADAKISAGLINPDQSGHGFAVFRFPSNIKLAGAAITLEPDGGSPQPTMPIYAFGKA